MVQGSDCGNRRRRCDQSRRCGGAAGHRRPEGLTSGLSRALARPGFVPVHDRGRVLADTAVLTADGGRVLSDLATLRDQAALFGPVASDPTLWRVLSEIGETQRRRIARVRAKTLSMCGR